MEQSPDGDRTEREKESGLWLPIRQPGRARLVVMTTSKVMARALYP